MNWNLYDRLLGSTANDEAIFLECEDGKTLSYADLHEQCGRYASYLAELGIGPDHRVVAKVEKSVESIILYLATLRAGAVYLPLNTAYTVTETEYFIQDSRPSLVVCDPQEQLQLRPIVTAIAARLETLDGRGGGSIPAKAFGSPSNFDAAVRSERDLAAILYTSGTTGRSKGAVLTHGNLVSNALTSAEQWCYGSDDILIHALPIYHIHGLFVACNVTFAARARTSSCAGSTSAVSWTPCHAPAC